MSKRTQTLKSRPQYDTIKEYYGQTLQKSSHLQTDACCDKDALPDYVRCSPSALDSREGIEK